MVEAFLAFAIWASAGALFGLFEADPVLSALLRYFMAGLLLLASARLIGFFRPNPPLPQPIRWRDSRIWLSGVYLVGGNIFYNLSVSRGPTALAGLIYGYIPIVLPIVSYFLGLERRVPLRARNWQGFFVAFFGNYLLFLGFHRAQINVGEAVIAALIGAVCFGLTALAAADLQEDGLTGWTVLKNQNGAAMLISVPVALVLFKLKILSEDFQVIKQSLQFGAMAAIFLTILPFFLWFRGIQKVGVGRTSVFVFLNPLFGCLYSMFALKDMPVSTLTVSGSILILLGILMNIAKEH